MNTRIRIMNDAFMSISENMGKKDAFSRYLLTAILIGMLLAVPPISYLNPITIAANYLFTTALMRWDPIYALLGLRFAHDLPVSGRQSEGQLRSVVAVKTFHRVANDSHHSTISLKKAG